MHRSLRHAWEVLAPCPIAVSLIGIVEAASGRSSGFAAWWWVYLMYGFVFSLLPSLAYAAFMEWRFSRGLPMRSVKAIVLSTICGAGSGFSIALAAFASATGIWTPLPFSIIGGLAGALVAIVVAVVPWEPEIRRKAAEPGATDNPADAQRLREDH